MSRGYSRPTNAHHVAPLAHYPAPPDITTPEDDLLALLDGAERRDQLAPLSRGSETPTLDLLDAPQPATGPRLDQMLSVDASGPVAAPKPPAARPAPPTTGGPGRQFARARGAKKSSGELTDEQRANGMAALESHQPSDADLLNRAHSDLAIMHERAAKGQSQQIWGGRIGKAGTAVNAAAAVSAVVPGGQVATGPLAAIGAGLKAGGHALSAAGHAQEGLAAHQVAKYSADDDYNGAMAVREHAASKGGKSVVSAIDAVVPLPPIVSSVASVGAEAHEKSIQSRLGEAVGEDGRNAIAAESFQKADHERIERGGRGKLAMLRDRVLGRDGSYDEGFTDLGSDAHRVAADLRDKR
jgi:hypothetical protein